MFRAKERRCRNFDPEGYPFRGGCPRKASECFYIHPTDPEWTITASRISSDSRPSTLRRRSHSRSPRRHSPSRHSRDYRRPFTADSGDRPGWKTGPPPAGSSSTRAESSSRAIRRDSSSHHMPRGSESVDVDRRNPETEKEKELVQPALRLPREPKEAQLSQASLPSLPANLPPLWFPSPAYTSPPPDPTTAQPVSAQPQPTDNQELPDVDSKFEEKRKIWVNRIRLIADYCVACKEHLEWETEVHKSKSVLDSERSNTLEEAAKRRLEQDLATALGKCTTLKQEMDDAVQKLIELDLESTINPGESIAKPVLERINQEVKEMKEAVDQFKLLNDSEQVELSTKSGPKRQPLSEDDEELSQNNAQGTREHMEDQIRILERRLEEQENEIYQREDDIIADLTEKLGKEVENKMTELWEIRYSAQKRQTAGGQGPSVQDDIEAGEIVSDIKTKLKQAENNILVMREEIEQVKATTSLLEERTAHVIRQGKAVDEDIAQMAADNKKTLTVVEQLLREQEALKVTVQAHATRMAQAAALPPPPTMEQIIDALREPTEDLVRQNIAPILLGHREEIEQMVSGHNEELCNGVLGKLSVITQMTGAVSAWLSEGDIL